MARKKAATPLGGKAPRTRLAPALTARKSAPQSAGGVNAARIERYRGQEASVSVMQRELSRMEKKARVKDKKAAKAHAKAQAGAQAEAQAEAQGETQTQTQAEDKPVCRNPFCARELRNRYAGYCHDRALCQQYRLVQLQCSMNALVAAAEEDEEDNRPLSSLARARADKHKLHAKKKASAPAAPAEEVPFAIPRRKRLATQPDASPAPASDASSSVRTAQHAPKARDDALAPKTKRKKLRQPPPGASVVDVTAAPDALEHALSVSSSEDAAPLASLLGKKRVRPRDPRVRRPVALQVADSDGEVGKTVVSSADNASGAKKRRLVRHASADDALRLPVSSSPVRGGASARKPPTSRAVRAALEAQAAKKMAVALVPLGAANQTPSFAGGGRYVQNGNRSAAQALRATTPLPRAARATGVAPVAPVAPVALPVAATPAAVTPTASVSQSLAPQMSQAPPTTWTTASASTSASSSADASRLATTVTPSTSPVPNPVTTSRVSSASAAPPAPAPPARKAGGRMTTSEYLQKRKKRERGAVAWSDSGASRSASLERSDNTPNAELTSGAGGEASGPAYPSRHPEYHRGESVPLPGPAAGSAFRLREAHRSVDPRRLLPEVEDRYYHPRPRYGDEGIRLEPRDGHRSSVDFMGADMYAAGQREGRHYPPPRDRPLPPRAHSSSSFTIPSGCENGYDYGGEPAPFSPSSSPAEPPLYRRERPREDFPERAPERPRGPDPRRPEPREEPRQEPRPEHETLEMEWPHFSYHEAFVSRLLSRFILKFPYALEAVHNKTVKPRKMKFYLEYVSRIERLCQDFQLKVMFLDSANAVVKVRDREWLRLKSTSTIALYTEVIKSLLAEAMAWGKLKETVEKVLTFYRLRFGENTNLSLTFMRAWNEFKAEDVGMPCQVNYVKGAKLHHWNFVLGNVELGSGSHEQKRVAFDLATARALEFVRGLADSKRRDVGWNASREKREERQRRERGREQQPQPAQESPRHQRSSSRDSSVRERPREPTRGSPRGQQRSSSHDSSVSSRKRASPRVRDSATTSSAAPAAPSAAVEPPQEPPVAIIPTSDSNSSHETSGTVGNDDTGEDMSISEDDPETTTKADETTPPAASSSPTMTATAATLTTTAASTIATPPTTAAVSTTADVPASSASVPAPATASTAPTKASPATVAAPSTGSSGPAAASASAAAASAPSAPSKKDAPAKPPAAKRCMMCEMIRMRKPDGERCLRCQQGGAGRGFVSSAVVDP